MKGRKSYFIAYLIFIFITTAIFFYTNKPINAQNFKPFYRDTDNRYKVEAALALDPAKGDVRIARAFHNKLTASFDTFTDSIYKNINPAFLFGFSKTPLYTDSTDLKLLYPIEFPLFLLSIFILTRKNKLKEGKYLLIVLVISIVCLGIFIPKLHPLKVLPLVILIRTIIFMGISQLIIENKWIKKYSF
jgi:hypothetical protein